jgi:hypothetical protein
VILIEKRNKKKGKKEERKRENAANSTFAINK